VKTLALASMMLVLSPAWSASGAKSDKEVESSWSEGYGLSGKQWDRVIEYSKARQRKPSFFDDEVEGLLYIAAQQMTRTKYGTAKLPGILHVDGMAMEAYINFRTKGMLQFNHALKTNDDNPARAINVHDPIISYLFRIAFNKGLDCLRREDKPFHNGLSLSYMADTIADNGANNPATNAEQSELIAIVMDVLQDPDQLTPDQRQVIQHRFLNQLSIRETARMMDKTEGAIKSLQRRAIAALRIAVKTATDPELTSRKLYKMYKAAKSDPSHPIHEIMVAKNKDLTPDQRAILDLYFAGSRPDLSAIAQKLGSPYGRTREDQRTAVKWLRKHMPQYHSPNL